MKKVKIIVVIFNIFLFIFGSVMLTVGLVNGGTLLFNIDYFKHKVVTSYEAEYVTYEENVDEFKNFKLNIDASKIRFKTGDTYKVEYKTYEDERPEFEVKDGTLIINKDNHPDNRFGINTLNFNKNEDEIIEITVPENAILDNGTIEVNYGNILIDDLTIKALNIDADASNIEFNSVEIADLEIDSDYGDVDVSESRLDDASISVDAGSVDLKLIGERADYKIDFDIDAGSAQIDGDHVENNFKETNSNNKQLSVEIDAGSVSVEF